MGRRTAVEIVRACMKDLAVNSVEQLNNHSEKAHYILSTWNLL